MIAETILFAVDKEGREFEIRAGVGLPYQTESGDWACAVALEGLHERLHDIYGVDSWQSLVLGMNLVNTLLGCFVEAGGKLYREKGAEEMPIERFGFTAEPPEPEWPPTEEQQARIDGLTADQIRKIDEAIVANASTQWRKVARIVGSAMTDNSGIVPSIPDVFYAERVRNLVAAGKLESQGNLEFMRFSEVRLADDRAAA